MRYHIVEEDGIDPLCKESSVIISRYGDKLMTKNRYELLRYHPKMCGNCVSVFEKSRKEESHE